MQIPRLNMPKRNKTIFNVLDNVACMFDVFFCLDLGRMNVK